MNTQQSSHTISEDDLAILRQQLGREPRGSVSIPARSNNIPLVIQVRSWVANQPFPTLYWLSSKDLDKAISGLEAGGLVKKLEEKLQEDTDFKTAFLQNQQQYIDSRWYLMHPQDKQKIEQAGFTEMFNKLGIGGIAQHDKIRCLHMQYAHHLAESNIVGEWLDENYQLNDLDIKL